MITIEEFGRFAKLREDLFDALRELLTRDGHCKSYEGAFRIEFPAYFESRESRESRIENRREPWGILLDCYKIGPSRHYNWWAETFAEVLVKAETDIRAWMHEALEEE